MSTICRIKYEQTIKHKQLLGQVISEFNITQLLRSERKHCRHHRKQGRVLGSEGSPIHTILLEKKHNRVTKNIRETQHTEGTKQCVNNLSIFVRITIVYK